MPRSLTASDRKNLIRLASDLEKGTPERRAILAGLGADTAIKQVGRYRDKDLAFRASTSRGRKYMVPVLLGDDGKYWVPATPAHAEILIRAGYDVAPKPSALKSASRDGFHYEGDEFGVMISSHFYQQAVTLYFPLENIGRRGKTITEVEANFHGTGSTAWADTFLHRVKGLRRASQALRLLQAESKAAREAGWEVRFSERKIKGVSPGLPTPTSQKIDDIEGRFIKVDMNSKPIRVYDPAFAEELEKSFQRYRFEIPHRYKNKVHAVRDEIAAARSHTDVQKILTRNKVRFDFRTYMDPMYQ